MYNVSLQILLTVFRDLYVQCITSLQILLTVSRIHVRMEPHVQMKVSPIVVHVLEIGLEISVAIVSSIHTSQQRKRYKGLMLNIC
jgi:hypothetical protein